MVNLKDCRSGIKMFDNRNYQIAFDHREKCIHLLNHLAENERIQLSRTTLSLGDYLLDSEVLIERKSITDFVQSLCNGRLFSQMYRLTQSDYQVALLLEGCASDIKKFNISREAVLGAIASISLIMEIPILRSANQIESAKILIYCAKQKREKNRLLTRAGRKPKRIKTQQLHLIQGLPNVGAKLAKRLLEYFGSIEQIFNATDLQLMDVEGVGSHTANKIKTLLTKKYS